MDEDIKSFDFNWNKLYNEGILLLFSMVENRIFSNISKEIFMKLHSIVFEICLLKNNSIPQKLAEKVSEVTEVFIQKIYLQKFSNQTNQLEEFSIFWNSFFGIFIKWALKICSYLVNANSRLKKSYNLKYDLINIFQKEVFNKCKEKITQEFLDEMENERKNIINNSNINTNTNTFNVPLMKGYIHFISNVFVNPIDTLYTDEIEKLIVEENKKYFQLISETYLNIDKLGLFDYIQNSTILINQNRMNLCKYLPENTVELITSEIMKILYYNNSKFLLENQFYEMLNNNSLKSSLEVYKIFKDDSRSVSIMINIFKNYSKNKFRELIAKYNNYSSHKIIAYSTNYIDSFKIFYNSISNVCEQVFESNNIFFVSFKEVIENIQLNESVFNNSYIFPYYLDRYLNRGIFNDVLNSNPNTNIQEYLNKILTLFPSLPDKDIFVEGHRQLLSIRLLHENWKSLDDENYLIAKLQNLCGSSYITKIESMMNDYFESKNFNNDVHKSNNTNETNNINISQLTYRVLLIDSANWPTLKYSKINLPTELNSIKLNIESYYYSNFQNRNILISVESSQCEIFGKIDGNKYNIKSNTIQACILLLFNKEINRENNGFSEEEIINSLCISKNDLNENIAKLLHIKLLEFNSISNSKYILNKNFFSISKQIYLNSSKYSDSLDEGIVKKEKIENDRSSSVEAAIIREMKKVQKINHNNLVTAVFTYLSLFKVEIELIKRKIENMVDRGMIVRDKENYDVYIYTY